MPKIGSIRHTYELKYDNGELYHPLGHLRGGRSLMIEEVEYGVDTLRFSTSLVVEDERMNRNNVYRCHMTEMTPGRIRRYGAEFFLCQGAGMTTVRTRMDFDGSSSYRSSVRKTVFRGSSVRVRKKELKGSLREYQFVGMFHYTCLYHRKIRQLLQDLRPDNTGKFRDLPFNSLEINPLNGRIFYWKILLKEIVAEYSGGTEEPSRLYRLRFEADPGLLTRIYFRLRNIRPEFHLWLTEDKEKIYQIEEFSSSGRKVIYRLVL